jgi:hypothetical protein
VDGEKSEEWSSSGVKQEKFSKVPMGFLANALNVVLRNTTKLLPHSNTLFTGDPYVHFKRREYHLSDYFHLNRVYSCA